MKGDGYVGQVGVFDANMERCMGAIFRFHAVKAETGEPMKCEVFLGGRQRGFTPDRRGQFLEVETEMSGRFDWYAKRYGETVDRGSSSGGVVRILI